MQQNIFRSSMLNGLIMGGLFSVNFLFSAMTNPVLSLLSNLIIIYILIYTYKSTVKYRDHENEGSITYGKAFSFITLSYFFAGVISGIVKYIYFQFIKPDYLMAALDQSLVMMEKMNFPVSDQQVELMESMMKPATYALEVIWLNIFVGMIVGLIMAAFIKKEKDIFAA